MKCEAEKDFQGLIQALDTLCVIFLDCHTDLQFLYFMTTKLVVFHKQVPVNSVFAFTDSITFLQMCLALQFADDADLTGGSNGELKDLINRLIDNAMT